MKFITITLIVHAPDSVTGKQKSTHHRFREVLENAGLAELGFGPAPTFDDAVRPSRPSAAVAASGSSALPAFATG